MVSVLHFTYARTVTAFSEKSTEAESSEANAKEEGEEEEAAEEKVENGETEKPEPEEPKPRALHRTCSIFLRNLAPTITKQEVEAVRNFSISLNTFAGGVP